MSTGDFGSLQNAVIVSARVSAVSKVGVIVLGLW